MYAKAMRLAIRDGRLCLLAVRKEEAKARRKEKLQTENMSYFLKMGRGGHPAEVAVFAPLCI